MFFKKGVLVLVLAIFFIKVVLAASPTVTLLTPLNGSITSGNSILLDSFIDDEDADDLTYFKVWTYYNDTDKFDLMTTSTTLAPGSHQIFNLTTPFTPLNVTSNTLFLAHFDNTNLSEESEAPLLGSGTYGFTSVANGKFNTALDLSTDNSRIVYSETNNFNLTQGTIQFWLKPTEAYSGSAIKRWFTGNSDSTFYVGWDRSTISGTTGPIFFMNDASSATDWVVVSMSSMSTGEWHFMTYVWNTTYQAVYIDGNLNGSKNINSVSLTNTPNITLGDISGPDADAYIDDLRILDRPLTSSEINESYRRLVNGKYYWKVEVSDGTNRLNSTIYEFNIINKLINISSNASSITANKGDNFTLNISLTSLNHDFSEDLTLEPLEPYGYGITTSNGSQSISGLGVNQSISYIFTLNAKRANIVNLNQTWQMKFRVSNGTYYEDVTIPVSVTDTQQGKIYYLYTADVEQKVGVGGDCAWSNEDNITQPLEGWLHMINKTKLLYEGSAKPYGAKWNYQITIGSIHVILDSEAQSTSGNWTGIGNEFLSLMANLTAEGNDISFHTHPGKDSRQANSTQIWNSAQDAYSSTPNPLGAMLEAYPTLGNYSPSEYNVSYLSHLYYHLGYIERYGRLGDPAYRHTLYRTGGHAMGDGIPEESLSIRSLTKLKVLANTDHNGNEGDLSVNSGDNLFFIGPGDINNELQDLRDLTLLESSPTNDLDDVYNLDTTTTNTKFETGYNYSTTNNIINPGVHSIMLMTHPFQECGLNNSGAQDWTVLNVSGDFEVLYNHTRYVNQSYTNNASHANVTFSNAKTFALEYYDYYSPKVIAWRDTEFAYLTDSQSNQLSKYNIRLLGRDIPIDSLHQHNVSVKYPSYFENYTDSVSIYKNKVLNTSYDTGSNDFYPDLNFTVSNSSDNWSMVVQQSRYEFPYVTTSSSTSNSITLNVASPYTFLRMNMLINESFLQGIKSTYNHENISSINLTLHDGSSSLVTNYLVDENELLLPNITIQNATGSNQIKITFATSSSSNPSTGPTPSDGGGGGGIETLKFNEEYQLNLNQRIRLRIDTNNDGTLESYLIRPISFRYESVALEITTSPAINIALKQGEGQNIDLNEDGKFDITLKITLIDGEKATIYVSNYVETKVEGKKKEIYDIQQDTPRKSGIKSSYLYIIASIVLVGIVTIYLINKFKYKHNKPHRTRKKIKRKR